MVETDPKNIYRRIPELNGLMEKVREGHGRLLDSKHAELLEIVRQCMQEVHTLSDGNADCAEPVSYTHLDVYKRQAIGSPVPGLAYSCLFYFSYGSALSAILMISSSAIVCGLYSRT